MVKKRTMLRYECSNCKYKFTPKTNKVPKACPYCSQVGTVSPVKGMQELLDETLNQEE